MTWWLFGSFARAPATAHDIDLICDIEDAGSWVDALPHNGYEATSINSDDAPEPLREILKQCEQVAEARGIPVDIWFEPYPGSLNYAGFYPVCGMWEFRLRMFGSDFGYDANPVSLCEFLS